ncbi:MAG: hypothetical protein HC881_11230 [Leptolyngbyaceae cyanobacterium SL_7_1]|nr:hypothetical protein [Leptolyngbyaceae cyanobacterium SL_7_1]
MADFNRAVTLDPEYGSAYLYRGIVQTELGDRASAMQNLTGRSSWNRRMLLPICTGERLVRQWRIKRGQLLILIGRSS